MRTPLHHIEPDRRTRLLASTAAALLAVTLLVEWWPATAPEPPPIRPPGPEIIATMEEIVRTTQAAATPPPPVPELPPVEVEDEVVLQDIPLDVERVKVPAPPLPGPPADAPPGEDDTTERASGGGVTRDPTPVRMTQPTYTDEAQRRRVRAEVRVEVQVNTSGRVEKATIRERYVLGRGDERTAVEKLDYGLEDAALDAARRWMFRPAMRNGERVAQSFVLTLSWGTSR